MAEDWKLGDYDKKPPQITLNGKMKRRLLTTDFRDFTDFKRVIKINGRNLPSTFGWGSLEREMNRR
jgi:hypothetical protein